MTIEKFSPHLNTSKDVNAWHAIHADEILRHFDTLSEHGLTSAEAAQRLQTYGPNALAEAPQTTFWQMLWDQFNNFVVILLIIAAIISALLGDMLEAAAIMAIVILNAALGVIQERRAEKALAALRKLAAPEAHVIRDGSRKTIPASELVPGDLVLLEAGNFVPADIRLLEAINLRIDESALTGESVAVQKDAEIHLEQDILDIRHAVIEIPAHVFLIQRKLRLDIAEHIEIRLQQVEARQGDIQILFYQGLSHPQGILKLELQAAAIVSKRHVRRRQGA